MTNRNSDLLIPRLIHQTCRSGTLSGTLSTNVRNIKNLNPEWEYHLYDDEEAVSFIEAHYGATTTRAYLSISSQYGAARADLFRYLLMYVRGGVYLDIKSTTTSPLVDVIRPDDEFLIAQWINLGADGREGWGNAPELSMVPGGEFQQWHIICRPQHSYLEAVIERVLGNLARYSSWRNGVGQYATLRMTGPIPYTLAIFSMLHRANHRTVGSERDIGLAYSVFPGTTHKRALPSHYSGATDPLVISGGLGKIDQYSYAVARRIKRALFG